MDRARGRVPGVRTCRVVPDLPAVDRPFDYLVPDEIAGRVGIGTIVRVPLHGRRVRGWVVADGVEPVAEPEDLKPLMGAVSAGPPPGLVELAGWVAHRWCGPLPLVLRAASPPTIVPPAPVAATPGGTATAPVTLVEWPPATPRLPVVRAHLASAGSSLIVLPAAARAGSLVRGLRNEGRRVIWIHAGLPDRDRTAAWDACRRGDAVVVGGRVAVWAPLPDLGAVVVLDEGDESLQEERVPTWNARDVAAERARRAGAACAFVTPVPTLEAEARAETIQRPNRADARAGWPAVEVVDPRDEAPGRGLLTDAFTHSAHRTLDAGARVVVFVNRTGRARLLACAACGVLARCETCGAAVGEPEPDVLHCPRCASERPRVCLACGASRMKLLRAGVSRLRDDLAALFPRHEVTEVSAGARAVPPASVLVGTEAVLHWAGRVEDGERPPPVRLVAFLDFDQELLAPRYRAAEQALWLLMRAARLLGGRERGGCILVQTRVPDHEVVAAAVHADPARVSGPERERRRALGFPPFGALAELSGMSEAVAAAAAALRHVRDVEVLGPITATGGARALIRAANHDVLAGALGPAAAAGRAHGRLRVAVDPLRV